MKKLFYFSLLFFFIVINHSLFAQPQSLRISPETLKQQLNQFVVLDARSEELFNQGHVEGAINFPINLTYHNNKINGKISQPIDTQKNFRLRGLTKDSKVIVYDDGALSDAARLFWVLEVYGLTQVKVLDRGYDDWSNKNYPISLENSTQPPSQYIATINHKRLASKFTTQIASHNSNQIIIDARSISDYTGKTSTAKRFGHIPTAINIPFSQHISKQDGVNHLKSTAQLRDLYSQIPKDKKVILYCSIGRISSTNYLALRELGHDVANYDASWNEWANDFNLPIEK